jgi:exopolysaccharide production protein ExoZ
MFGCVMNDKKVQIDGVQILRFWAAMGVVLFHVGSSLQIAFGFSDNLFGFGAAGVDVFFVISGFIIAYTARPEKGVLNFVRRRLARIIPIYWFLTIGVAGIALFLPFLLNSTVFEWGHLLKSLFFIPHEAPNGVVKPMLFLGWTLNYEMFFYALFALALVAGRHASIVCSAVMLLFVVAGQVVDVDSIAWRFYTNTIILEFLYGMGLYAAFRYWPDLFGRYGSLLFMLFIASVLTSFMVSDLPRFVGQGMPSLFLVASALSIKEVRRKTLLLMVVGGDISYSMYLSHPYLIQPVIKVLAPKLGFWLSLPLCFVAVVACIFGAYVLYRIVEIPSQRFLQKP